MVLNSSVEARIFNIKSNQEFDLLASEIYAFQSANCQVFKAYLNGIGQNEVQSASNYTFLPIDFFRTNKVVSETFTPELIFRSSGTTGTITSQHFVRSAKMYRKSLLEGFKRVLGNPSDYCILALLPSYLERPDSSLVWMTQELMKIGSHPDNGFFMDEFNVLNERLRNLEKAQQKTLLIGVSFALLEFSKSFRQSLMHTRVMETGGMKGRGKELVREELHNVLKDGFGVSDVMSEYGMTELLSQGYAVSSGIYKAPPWMRISIRDPHDPFIEVPNGRPGAVNVIDLANVYSCSFIATQDIGISRSDGTFEILGRMDNSDIRGCNLLFQN